MFSILLVLTAVHLISANIRELVPTEAPSNLTLLEIKHNQALIEWQPVNLESVRGNFRGYLVCAWNHASSQTYAFPSDISRAAIGFFPHSKNFITVSVKNDKYFGPPSQAISFDAPQIAPNSPKLLQIHQLSSNNSILVIWEKPTTPNGVLTGYKIYINATVIKIEDPNRLQAKITNLTGGATYLVALTATNCAGESDKLEKQFKLRPHFSGKVSIPRFTYKIVYKPFDRTANCDISTDSPQIDVRQFNLNETSSNWLEKLTESSDCYVKCLITWLPDVRNNPGDHFYIKHRSKFEPDYQISATELKHDFIVLHKFNACKNNELVLVAKEGDFEAESAPVLTPTKIG